jgi:hypothetical protein
MYRLHHQGKKNRRARNQAKHAEKKYIVFLRSLLLLLVTANVIPSSPILVTPMLEAMSSSPTSVLTSATLPNIPGEDILHSHRRGNFKSYTISLFVSFNISNFNYDCFLLNTERHAYISEQWTVIIDGSLLHPQISFRRSLSSNALLWAVSCSRVSFVSNRDAQSGKWAIPHYAGRL